MSEEIVSAYHLALVEQAGYRSMLLLYREPYEHHVRVLIDPELKRMRIDVLPPEKDIEPHQRKHGWRIVHWYKEERLRKAIRALILEHHVDSHDKPWSGTFDAKNRIVK